MRIVSALIVMMLSAWASSAASQTSGAAARPTGSERGAATVAGPARPFTPSRTADGQPDLQGVWTNATITPFERPAAQGSKAFLTEEEAAALEKRTLERRVEADSTRPRGDVGSYNDFWMDSGTRVVGTRQTSLVVEPADGRVPVTRAAEKMRDDNNARSTDSYDFMSVWDRCITRGVPGAMFPAGYNNAYQIIQTPGYVVIAHEMIHDARIIPIDGRAHLPSSVKLWNGDARGHWEGSTLVVETTNFNGKGWIATNAASGRIKGIPQSESLHIVERFTRVSADTINYEVTITDPPMYSAPWKVSIPLVNDPNYEIYEYACHEGNHAVENILRGARAQEK
jgi:hypothetical protein